MSQLQNSYPMRDWHLENMKKTVVKYLTGLPDNATSHQRRQHKKYAGNLANVHRNIQYDIKHGVTIEEVLSFLDEVKIDSKFASLREKDGCLARLDLLKIHFTTPMPY